MCGELYLKLIGSEAEKVIAKEWPSRIQPQEYLHEVYDSEDLIPREDIDLIVDNPIKGKHVLLTGFGKEKVHYGHVVHELGAILQKGGITKKTQILICGKTAGPKKVEKAKECSLQIMELDEFIKIVEWYYGE